jgi:hypothetical protein
VFDKASEVFVYGPSSVGDTATISMIGTGNVWFRDAYAKARPTGAYNFFNAIGTGGHLYLSGVLDLSTGAGTTTICDWGSAYNGTLHIDHFRTVGGSYGFYIEAASGGSPSIIVGPDVNISSTGSNALAGPGLSGVTWTVSQAGATSISGSTTIYWTQSAKLCVTAAATVVVPAIPNLIFLVDNTASSGAAVVEPAGGSSITVASGKSAWLTVNAAATAMTRTTADT